MTRRTAARPATAAIGAEIVTADGEVRLVDADHEPDLFWAIRGGGGNFGVVTRFQFRLHPLEPVVGGMLIQPATPETVAQFLALAAEAPDELSVIANVMPCPPMPFVPDEHHGPHGNFAAELLTEPFKPEGAAMLECACPCRTERPGP